MSDIIDFESEKMKRDVGENCRMVMPDGSTWYKFSADYRFPEGSCVGGGTFSISLWARNQAEAEARIQAIRDTLSEPIQVFDEIPA